jgi:6-phosphogluconolactonase
MSERRVLVHADKQELATSVAGRFIGKLHKLFVTHDVVHVVLTGGTMGSAVLSAINTHAERDTVDWSRVHFWWGDERWLPRGDADRNETQSRDALLNHIDVPAANIHAMPADGEGVDLDAAALQYAAELAAHAAPATDEKPALTWPHFDITFLGVGPDGHIASLFPERGGIREKELTVISVRNSPKPPPERLSLTLPVINSSRRVWLVMAGADKASALGLTLAGASANEVPAAGVKAVRRVDFHVDKEATAEVPENLVATEIYWTAADSPE